MSMPVDAWVNGFEGLSCHKDAESTILMARCCVESVIACSLIGGAVGSVFVGVNVASLRTVAHRAIDPLKRELSPAWWSSLEGQKPG